MPESALDGDSGGPGPAAVARLDTISSHNRGDQGVRAGLKANGGGYVVNVLSTLSCSRARVRRLRRGQGGAVSASNAMRLELLDQGHARAGGPLRAARYDMGAVPRRTKLSPDDVVAQTIRAIEIRSA